MTQTFKIFTAAVIKIGVVFLQHNIAELQITFRMLKFSRQLWHLNPVIVSLNQIYILDIFFLCLHETILYIIVFCLLNADYVVDDEFVHKLIYNKQLKRYLAF